MEISEKKLQIMEVAEALFADKGFNGTSVRDIAEKAGVNLAMISYYFGSKDKLLEAIFEYRGEKTKLVLENIASKSDLPSLEKVNLMIDHYISKIAQQKCFHRIMVREQALTTKGTIADLILKMKLQNYAVVHGLLTDGQKSGEFRKDIDLSLLMTTMMGTANHLFTSQHYYRLMNNMEDMPEEEFQAHLKKKLTKHLKFLFKTILSNEA
ncbi:MAG: TetR family transcriptional regulator [Ferruginibacter sp.]